MAPDQCRQSRVWSEVVTLSKDNFNRDYDYKSMDRSEEHTSELQSRQYLVCRLLLEKKKKISHDMLLTVRVLASRAFSSMNGPNRDYDAPHDTAIAYRTLPAQRTLYPAQTRRRLTTY